MGRLCLLSASILTPLTPQWAKGDPGGLISHKRNRMFQPQNLITLTNSFEVLGNLDEASEKATSNLQKAPNTSCAQKEKPRTSKEHSVILLGDSHVRGIADRLSLNLGSSFHTTGCAKPSATLNYITSSEISELRKLSKSDMVVLCGGTLDIARNDSMQGLASISRFVENLDRTNVVVVDAPHRFDLDTFSCVNKEVITFNRKLQKILKHYNHASQINLPMERKHFTKHGLHMNGTGKDQLSGLLTSKILELFVTQPTVTPITIPLKDKAAAAEEEQKRPTSGDSTLTCLDHQLNAEIVKHSQGTYHSIDNE